MDWLGGHPQVKTPNLDKLAARGTLFTNAPRSRPAMTSHGPGNDSARSETHRYIRYADGSEELYDMRKDPHEFKNLASDPKTKKIKKKLASYLPKTSAKPVEGSNARLIERKKDGSVYWQNTLIETPRFRSTNNSCLRINK